MRKSRSSVVALLNGALLCASLAFACSKDQPKSTRWDDASAAALAPTGSAGAPAAAPVAAAGTLNKFFPKDGDGGFKRVFAADKEGYAEAKLQKDGKDVAVVSISDAENLGPAKAKFDGATEKLEGFPLMTVGKNQSTVLVKGRFQVKVSSQTLDHDAALDGPLEDIQNNRVFQFVSEHLPGGIAEQRDTIKRNIEESRGHLESMVANHGITQESVLDKVKEYVAIADDKLDVVAAALDLGTNTFEHTGVQTVARRVVQRAYGEI